MDPRPGRRLTATEWVPDWLAIRHAIDEWKQAADLPQPAPLFDRKENPATQ